MKKLILFILVLSGLTSVGFAQEKPQAAIDQDLSQLIKLPVEKYQLENGMTVLLHEDHTVPTVSVHQWYRVGSRNERPGRTGLAHFFEHLMFKGTQKYPSGVFDDIIQANGGTNNAFTSMDFTGYYVNIPPQALELILDIESDRMVNLVLQKDGVQAEREVVKEERRFRVENSVYGSMNEAMYRTVYKVHPYRWPVIGYMADLNAASMDDLKEFYRIYYSPNNSVLVISGDFDSSKAKELIQKYYAKISSQPLPELNLASEPEQKGQRNTTVTKDVQNPYFTVAFRTVEAGSHEAYALDLLANILGAGDSSRMYKRLVYKEQIATSVSVSSYMPKDPGTFSISVAVKPGGDIEQAIRSVYGELYRARTNEIMDEELAKAKNQVMKSYVDNMKTVYGRAELLAVNEILFNDYTRAFEDLNKYNGVSKEQVMEVAKKYLLPLRRSVIRVQPKSSQLGHVTPMVDKSEGAES